jgi:hypothetical protein
MYKKHRNYGFDYSTPDEIADKNPNLEKINKMHKSLNEDNYLTHLVMACQHKNLTKEQKDFHLKRATEIIKEDNEKIEKKFCETTIINEIPVINRGQ